MRVKKHNEICTNLDYPFMYSYISTKLKERGKKIESWQDLEDYLIKRPEKRYIYYVFLLDMGREVQKQKRTRNKNRNFSVPENFKIL